MESLTCDLFEPGMTPLHRAGLGGLVATLRKIENNDHPPLRWDIDDRSVTFQWNKESDRKAFFRYLFDYAFQLEDGLISLPSQYGDLEPSLEVKAALHEGLRLSFYGYSRSKKSSGPRIDKTYEVDEKSVGYSYVPLLWYKHKKEGYEQFERSLKGQFKLTGSFLPGSIKRHNQYNESQATLSAKLALPLLIAPIGVVALKAGGKKIKPPKGEKKFMPGAAMLIPDIHNLSDVQHLLSSFIPRSGRDCQVENLADAVLQAQLRLRGQEMLTNGPVPAVRCIWFCPSDWNVQQRPPSRVTEVEVHSGEAVLEQFDIALRCFPPSRRVKKDNGSGSWAKSYIRPLVAENLLERRPWYARFTRLMTAKDDSLKSPKPIRCFLKFERGGLHTMTQEITGDEKIIVRAVHEAMRCRYGRIAAENAKNQAAMKKRMTREYERQRLAFAGAKTADALRYALADLWSRAGSNSVLRESWPHVLPLLSNEKWQLARDLALLALASYQGKENIDLTEAEEIGETEEQ